jgi:Zn-dependent peptidase ImmA (M78 family)
MRSDTVTINPQLLTWARKRARVEPGMLDKRFPKLREWELGAVYPTLRQLELYAHAVHVPIGFLFLPEPVAESLPITDFRTVREHGVAQPSPNLLDTLYLCQQRQDWYRDYARLHSLDACPLVHSITINEDPLSVTARLSQLLRLSMDERQRLPTWSDALRYLIQKAEETGVLVMASSIVGSNSHRKLEVEEFRGFALSDEHAPVVFLNASDGKAAQIFTLAHELVHIALGQSGLFDTETGKVPEQQVERWCNAVAAELLVPVETLRQVYLPSTPLQEELQRLARHFKVSSLVILRRLFNATMITQTAFWQTYHQELERLNAVDRGSGGGDFYRTLGARTGKRFARAVLSSTLEGQTLFQDAFRMLGVRSSATFYQAARELEVMA